MPVPQRKRADAALNRERLLDAAQAVFLACGVHAPLDAVAERAGIGRATLFRNFPDRHALIAGLLDRTLAAIEAEATRADGDPHALARLLRFIADAMVERAPLTEYWQTLGHDSPEFARALCRLLAAFEQPIAWAVAGGTCRADLVTADVVLLSAMLGGALHARAPAQRRLLADRAWQFVVETARLQPVPSGPD